ncbi:MAG: MBOAT family protein [Clostridium sp.]|nr:MBOAT family protein [Clostridium sp.]
MAYHLLTYSLIFLPAVMLLYQLAPEKYRWSVLLAADYVFFWMISKWLILCLLAATVITYTTGRALGFVMESGKLKGKKLTARKRMVLACGVCMTLGMLIVYKYLKVFGISLIAPIGISYYTLQAISYMMDVYRGTIQAEKNFAKTALYLSFFPQIMEGPISRFGEVAEALYAGKKIEFENLVFGYQRIVWGLFKKMLIADRIAPMVGKVFHSYESYAGSAIAVGVICFTIQLYMEFSGCMDIVIGSGQIFGITLPENFRQPFFARNASDFWRRWHITLGAWLKDYVFYPVSLAKPVKKLAKKVKGIWGIQVSKFVAPTIALFLVWLSNGIWHGAGWTYLFYGMYYFVIIFLENILENSAARLMERMKLSPDGMLVRLLRSIKLFFIVNIGEMFFCAPTVSQGFDMLGRMLTGFNLSALWETNFGVDGYDMILAAVCFVIVMLVDVLHEKGISIRQKIASQRLAVRWGFWYAAILCIVIFGAYGAGYTVVDMIYAAY